MTPAIALTSPRLPDFIIAGAPRCATTWLYELAERHPAIAMAKPLRPEPKFFLVDELYDRGSAYYSSRWFTGLPETCIIGEKTTNYLENPAVAQRIHAMLPTVKLVFMLRNPVDRAWSNYRWSRQNGMETEAFGTALDLEAARERALAPTLRYARPHAYFSRGLYADLLTPYLRLFGRSQILILRQEDGRDAPQALAVKFHEFLGVEPRPEDAAEIGMINAATETSRLDEALRTRLTRLYDEPNRRLADLVGPDFAIW